MKRTNSPIHKAASLTVPGRSMILPGTIPETPISREWSLPAALNSAVRNSCRVPEWYLNNSGESFQPPAERLPAALNSAVRNSCRVPEWYLNNSGESTQTNLGKHLPTQFSSFSGKYILITGWLPVSVGVPSGKSWIRH